MSSILGLLAFPAMDILKGTPKENGTRRVPGNWAGVWSRGGFWWALVRPWLDIEGLPLRDLFYAFGGVPKGPFCLVFKANH